MKMFVMVIRLQIIVFKGILELYVKNVIFIKKSGLKAMEDKVNLVKNLV